MTLIACVFFCLSSYTMNGCCIMTGNNFPKKKKLFILKIYKSHKKYFLTKTWKFGRKERNKWETKIYGGKYLGLEEYSTLTDKEFEKWIYLILLFKYKTNKPCTCRLPLPNLRKTPWVFIIWNHAKLILVLKLRNMGLNKCIANFVKHTSPKELLSQSQVKEFENGKFFIKKY